MLSPVGGVMLIFSRLRSQAQSPHRKQPRQGEADGRMINTLQYEAFQNCCTKVTVAGTSMSVRRIINRRIDELSSSAKFPPSPSLDAALHPADGREARLVC